MKKDKENVNYKPSQGEIVIDRMEKNILERFDQLIAKLENFLKRPPVKYKD